MRNSGAPPSKISLPAVSHSCRVANDREGAPLTLDTNHAVDSAVSTSPMRRIIRSAVPASQEFSFQVLKTEDTRHGALLSSFDTTEESVSYSRNSDWDPESDTSTAVPPRTSMDSGGPAGVSTPSLGNSLAHDQRASHVKSDGEDSEDASSSSAASTNTYSVLSEREQNSTSALPVPLSERVDPLRADRSSSPFGEERASSRGQHYHMWEGSPGDLSYMDSSMEDRPLALPIATPSYYGDGDLGGQSVITVEMTAMIDSNAQSSCIPPDQMGRNQKVVSPLPFKGSRVASRRSTLVPVTHALTRTTGSIAKLEGLRGAAANVVHLGIPGVSTLSSEGSTSTSTSASASGAWSSSAGAAPKGAAPTHRRQSKVTLPVMPIVSPVPSPATLQQQETLSKLNVENVVLKERVGRGAYGDVFRGVDTVTGMIVAVKEVFVIHDHSTDVEKQLAVLEREVRVMRMLNHKNIVNYLGACRHEGALRIFMEFMDGGTMTSLLKKEGALKEDDARFFTNQLLCGLEYLHERHIVHRDLKGDNLFLTMKRALKVGDFGTSKELQTMRVTDSIAGTPNYMAPEVITCSGHSFSADIWGAGCCTIEMLTGSPPFSNLDNHMAVMFAVMKGRMEEQIPANISKEARDFVLQCTRKEPLERPTPTQLLHHPWILGDRTALMTAVGGDASKKNADKKELNETGTSVEVASKGEVPAASAVGAEEPDKKNNTTPTKAKKRTRSSKMGAKLSSNPPTPEARATRATAPEEDISEKQKGRRKVHASPKELDRSDIASTDGPFAHQATTPLESTLIEPLTQPAGRSNSKTLMNITPLRSKDNSVGDEMYHFDGPVLAVVPECSIDGGSNSQTVLKRVVQPGGAFGVPPVMPVFNSKPPESTGVISSNMLSHTKLSTPETAWLSSLHALSAQQRLPTPIQLSAAAEGSAGRGAEQSPKRPNRLQPMNQHGAHVEGKPNVEADLDHTSATARAPPRKKRSDETKGSASTSRKAVSTRREHRVVGHVVDGRARIARSKSENGTVRGIEADRANVSDESRLVSGFGFIRSNSDSSLQFPQSLAESPRDLGLLVLKAEGRKPVRGSRGPSRSVNSGVRDESRKKSTLTKAFEMGRLFKSDRSATSDGTANGVSHPSEGEDTGETDTISPVVAGLSTPRSPEMASLASIKGGSSSGGPPQSRRTQEPPRKTSIYTPPLSPDKTPTLAAQSQLTTPRAPKSVESDQGGQREKTFAFPTLPLSASQMKTGRHSGRLRANTNDGAHAEPPFATEFDVTSPRSPQTATSITSPTTKRRVGKTTGSPRFRRDHADVVEPLNLTSQVLHDLSSTLEHDQLHTPAGFKGIGAGESILGRSGKLSRSNTSSRCRSSHSRKSPLHRLTNPSGLSTESTSRPPSSKHEESPTAAQRTGSKRPSRSSSRAPAQVPDSTSKSSSVEPLPMSTAHLTSVLPTLHSPSYRSSVKSPSTPGLDTKRGEKPARPPSTFRNMKRDVKPGSRTSSSSPSARGAKVQHDYEITVASTPKRSEPSNTNSSTAAARSKKKKTA